MPSDGLHLFLVTPEACTKVGALCYQASGGHPQTLENGWAFFLASLGLQEILKEEPCRWLVLATAVVRLDV